MFNENIWLSFVIAILATWRITHLLAKEDGPAHLIARFRAVLGDGLLGQLMDCFKCTSMWIAAPIALLIFRRPLDCFLGWLAMSGAACLLELFSQQSIIIQPIPEVESQINEGGKDNGLLWSETANSQQNSGAISHLSASISGKK